MTEKIIEIWPADGFGPPVPVEGIEISFSFWQGYWYIFDWILPALIVIGGYIILRHVIWNSLIFNYHHYLEYGTFVIFWGDDASDSTKREQRITIADKLKIQSDMVSWCAALVMTAAILIMFIITAYLWPIMLIFVAPLIIVRLIGYHKRKKIAFTQKLKGEHLNV